jgi:hypothetical protein
LVPELADEYAERVKFAVYGVSCEHLSFLQMVAGVIVAALARAEWLWPMAGDDCGADLAARRTGQSGRVFRLDAVRVGVVIVGAA